MPVPHQPHRAPHTATFDTQSITKKFLMNTLSLSAGFPEAGLSKTGFKHAQPGVAATASAHWISQQMPERSSELSYAEMDDHALMAAIKAGEQEAFNEIVARYKNKLTNFVYRLLNDYERASDLTQETFIRIYTNADRYEASNNFSTYIYRIAQNLAISEIRQRKRRGLFQMPFFSSDRDGEELEVEVADKRILAPEDVMIDDERRAAVRRAITTLPEKYRVALVLRDVEGRSYEEISEILELSDGTVKSRINRARNLLKEKLREYL